MTTFPRVILPEGLQRPTLTAGTTRVQPLVIRSDKNNRWQTGGIVEVLDGTIDTDIDRAVKSTCRLITADPSILRPWQWVSVYERIIPEAGNAYAVQIGLYRLGQPRTRGRLGQTLVETPGEDIVTLLTQYRFNATYNIPAGGLKTDALRQLAALAGVTRTNFPTSVTILNTPFSISPSEDLNLHQAMTEITTSMGWYAPYGDNIGRLTSMPYRSAQATEPTRRYRIGDDFRVLGEVRTEQDSNAFANVIVVVSENVTDGTVLVAEARNDRLDSLMSTTHPDGPGIVVKTIIDNDITAATVRKLRAIKELEDRGIFAAADFGLWADFDLTVFDVILVEASRAHMADLRGVWMLQQINYQLGSGVITVKARRTET